MSTDPRIEFNELRNQVRTLKRMLFGVFGLALSAVVLVGCEDVNQALNDACIYENDPQAFSVLLSAGADVNAKSGGSTPLMMAVFCKKNPKVISVLLNAGADVNAKSGNGSTALHIEMLDTLCHARYEVTSQLLNAGADVNAKTADGVTPLMRAMECGANTDVILLLLDAGADANAKDKQGKAALDYVPKPKKHLRYMQ